MDIKRRKFSLGWVKSQNFFFGFVRKLPFLLRSQIRWNFWNRLRNEVAQWPRKFSQKSHFLAFPGVSVCSAKYFWLCANEFLCKVQRYLLWKNSKMKSAKNGHFGRKSKPLSHLHFSTDFKNFNGSETYEACATSVHHN